MKSFRRQIKAISPIFATLILIAIAIIAGVVVYMFTSGALTQMQGTTGGAQERMAVQSVQSCRWRGMLHIDRFSSEYWDYSLAL